MKKSQCALKKVWSSSTHVRMQKNHRWWVRYIEQNIYIFTAKYLYRVFDLHCLLTLTTTFSPFTGCFFTLDIHRYCNRRTQKHSFPVGKPVYQNDWSKCNWPNCRSLDAIGSRREAAASVGTARQVHSGTAEVEPSVEHEGVRSWLRPGACLVNSELQRRGVKQRLAAVASAQQRT